MPGIAWVYYAAQTAWCAAAHARQENHHWRGARRQDGERCSPTDRWGTTPFASDQKNFLQRLKADKEQSVRVVGQFADQLKGERDVLREQCDKQAQELKRGRDIVRHLETELHHLREREAHLQQQLLATKGVAKAGQQEIERLQKQLKASLSVNNQEANLVRQELEKAKRETELHNREHLCYKKDVNVLELQKQEIARLGRELKENKGAIQELQAKWAREHKALMESEKELALLGIKFDEFKAAAAAVASGKPRLSSFSFQ